jgi:hypothetical protein
MKQCRGVLFIFIKKIRQRKDEELHDHTITCSFPAYYTGRVRGDFEDQPSKPGVAVSA